MSKHVYTFACTNWKLVRNWRATFTKVGEEDLC
nr:MAG TPA: hypothetical protein [Caudoviricetes sp.]